MAMKDQKTDDINKTTVNIYDTSNTDTMDIMGATLKMLKHSKRYNEITIPRKILERILIFSLRGQNCDEAHLDVAQRHSLYKLAKIIGDEDPYISQFIKETEELYWNLVKVY